MNEYTPSSVEHDVREWRGINVVGYESALGGFYKNGKTCESVGGVSRALVRLHDASAVYDALLAERDELRKALDQALGVVSDRAAGGRMLTTVTEAKRVYATGRAALKVKP